MRPHKTRSRRVGTRPVRPSPGGTGFTLIELLVVITIVGILVAFILSAAQGGIRRAEERATQALIAKLDAGIADRMQALATTRAPVNATHAYLAAMWLGPAAYIPERAGSSVPAGLARAQVIAQYDRVKSQVPDVFVINYGQAGRNAIDANYPINFGGTDLRAVGFGSSAPVLSGPAQVYSGYLLPLGVGLVNAPGSGSFGASAAGIAPESTGIFGADYEIAGGIYKQFQGDPKGYDGADNNGNGLIDELSEGGLTLGSPTVANFLRNHTHETARAEMLYALLVEGAGPLGSVFDRDDFQDSEVRDTDNDGLLEFVDAWGEPLQFYRWPIYYSVTGAAPNLPDAQHGYHQYVNTTAPREHDPLDPNKQLLAPAWWSGDNSVNSFATNGPFAAMAAAPLSGAASVFQRLFVPLTDPWANPSVSAYESPVGGLWDRGGSFAARRAYYSRPLVLSGGPDKLPGVARLDEEYFTNLEEYAYQHSIAGYNYGDVRAAAPRASGATFPTGPRDVDSAWLLIEGQGGMVTPRRTGEPYQTPRSLVSPPNLDRMIDLGMQDVAGDDITNHNLQAPGGAIQ